jgi:hypothetical protein
MEFDEFGHFVRDGYIFGNGYAVDISLDDGGILINDCVNGPQYLKANGLVSFSLCFENFKKHSGAKENFVLGAVSSLFNLGVLPALLFGLKSEYYTIDSITITFYQKSTAKCIFVIKDTPIEINSENKGEANEDINKVLEIRDALLGLGIKEGVPNLGTKSLPDI